MELKKSNKANLDKNRGLFIEIGMLVALGVVLVAFEWQVAPKEEVIEVGPVQVLVVEDIIPITRQDEPPPPPGPPPKVTDFIDIVADDVQVENNIDINVETEQAVEINAVVFVGTVIQEIEEEEVFTIVEDMPLFNGKPAEEGFRDWVTKNMNYPSIARENGISGKVFVEFLINQTGDLVDAKLVRGADPLLDAEALRVIRMSPKWTPGKQHGKPVKVKYIFPVFFQLQN